MQLCVGSDIASTPHISDNTSRYTYGSCNNPYSSLEYSFLKGKRGELNHLLSPYLKQPFEKTYNEPLQDKQQTHLQQTTPTALNMSELPKFIPKNPEEVIDDIITSNKSVILTTKLPKRKERYIQKTFKIEGNSQDYKRDHFGEDTHIHKIDYDDNGYLTAYVQCKEEYDGFNYYQYKCTDNKWIQNGWTF